MPANTSLDLQGLEKPLWFAAAAEHCNRSEFIRRAVRAEIERVAARNAAIAQLLATA